MKIGNRSYEGCILMGILNVTPDSFFEDSRRRTREEALKACGRMIQDGADIIDIGGESTRPGSERVDLDEEMERVIPVIEAIRRNYDIPLSLDTYKYQVADAGIRSGADIVNLVYPLEKPMAEIIVKSDAMICITQNNIKADLISDRNEYIRNAMSFGIRSDKIIIDPGIGFGKSQRENLMCLERLEDYCSFSDCDEGFYQPVLLGASRKLVMGKALNIEVHDRLPATLAVTAWACRAGVSIIRVHDVAENRQVIDMMKAIENWEKA